MQPSQYKAVLAKVLRDAKIPNADSIADIQVRRMTMYNELLGDSVVLTEEPQGHSLVETQQAATQQQAARTRWQQPEYAPVDLSKGMLIGQSSVPEPDIFARVGPPIKQNLTDDQIMELKTRAIDNYKKFLPPTIDCLPSGFNQPLKLTLQSYQQGMPQMPVFKIVYAPQGMGEAGNIEMAINVCDAMPSPQQVIAEIQQAGVGKFHAKPVSSPQPMQQPAMPLGDKGFAFGVDNADDPIRPVQNIGDGLSGGAVNRGPDGKPMQLTEWEMLNSAPPSGYDDFKQRQIASRTS